MGGFRSLPFYFNLFGITLILINGVRADIPADLSGGAAPAGKVRELPRPETRRIILTRGNEWVSGLPGWEENAFTALYGLYFPEFPAYPEDRRIQGRPAGAFSVWLSWEQLYFSEGRWEKRPGNFSYLVFQRYEGDTLLVAAPLGDRVSGKDWTMIFQFPGGPAMSGLNDAGVNRLIEIWASRCLYFLSRAESPADLSLPAVLGF